MRIRHRVRLALGCAVIVAGVLLGLPARSPALAPAAGRAGKPWGQLPLHFEANRGQTDASVRYLARGPGYTVFVRDRDVVWRLRGADGDTALRLNLIGSKGALAVRAEGPLPGSSSYLRGNDPQSWVRGAPHYAAVRLDEVYPAIDLKLYSRQNLLEYDFIVRPGADPAAIRMAFEGGEGLRVDDRGQLVLDLPVGVVTQRPPVAWQLRDGRREVVAARFTLAPGGQVGFTVGDYDRARPLVIDPVYEYSSYLGGSGQESLTDGFRPYQAIAVDASGQAYVGGITNSVNFPQTTGGLQPTVGGVLDFYIAKISSSGDAILWATYLGGDQNELSLAGLKLGTGSEPVISGTTQSKNYPVTAGAYATTAPGPVGDEDIVVTRLNANGDGLVYSTYFGSSSGDTVEGFALDSSGNAYIAGQSIDFATVPLPTTPGVFQTSGGSYISKFNASGTSLVYSTRFGDSAGNARINSLALDSSSPPQVVVAGFTFGDVTTTPGAFDTVRDGIDGFASRLNGTGTALVYSTYLGGSGTDEPQSVVVDGSGNAYVVGNTVPLSPPNDFPTTVGSFRAASSLAQDGFVTKLNPAGTGLVYSTYLGVVARPPTSGLVLDAADRAYVVTGDFGTRVAEPPESCLSGFQSPQLSRLTASGASLDFAIRVGGNNGSNPFAQSTAMNGLAVDAANAVYVVGVTNAVNFPITGAFQPTLGGGSDDAFVAKIADAASLPNPTLQFSSASYSAGEAGGSATITVTRSGAVAGPINVQVATSNGTATAGSDYTATSATLNWTNGDLTPKTFVVPITNDGSGDPGETVNLTLTSAQTCLGTAGTPAAAVLTLTEGGGPAAGTLQLSAASYNVAETGNATVSVTRVGGSAGAVGATVTTSNGSASAGSDYTSTSATVNFADGDTATKTVNVPILEDTTDEPDETFTVALSAATGGAGLGAPSSATVTIADDDLPPPQPGSVQFAAATATVAEDGGPASVVLTRTGGSAGAISVQVASTGGSATAPADYAAVSQTVNWADGDAANKVVNVSIVDDALQEGSETIVVTASGPTGGATLGTPSAATVTITDDEQPPAAPVDASGSYGGGSVEGWTIGLLLTLAMLRGRRRAGPRLLAPVVALGLCLALLSPISAQAAERQPWRIGAQLHMGRSTLSEGDVVRALAGKGYTATADVDSSEVGGGLLIEYETGAHVLMQLAVLNLGRYDVRASATVVDPDQFLADVAAAAGDAGTAVSGSVGFAWHLADRWTLTPRVGLFRWDSHTRISSDARSVRIDRDDLDVTAGVDLSWQAGASWDLRLSVDHFEAGANNDVNTLGISAGYRF